MATQLTLVVMAAGVGSRFGGTKQLATVGPAGEALLDYTIHDARRAGFERVALIVRSDIEAEMVEHLREQHGTSFRPLLVCQDHDELAPKRARPWGTGHAILALRDVVAGPFVVVNADDFYGRDTFSTLATALSAEGDAGDYHLVAYRLDRTLSPRGTVSRGVCKVDDNGHLESITEHLAIQRQTGGAIVSDPQGRLAEDTPVSMNLWGLRPGLFDELRAGFARFVAEHGKEPAAEFQLPTVISEMVGRGAATVTVHRTTSDWLGVTYLGDLDDARTRMADYIAEGTYASPLLSC